MFPYKTTTSYKTKKLAMIFPSKDKAKTTQKPNLTYDSQCPSCKEHYICNTDQFFVTRLDKYGRYD